MFNLSSGVADLDCRELAELAARAVGNALPAVETEPGTRREDQIALDLVPDSCSRTGWTPAIPLMDGLVQTLNAIREEPR